MRDGRGTPFSAAGAFSQKIRDIRDIYKYIIVLHRVRLSRMPPKHPRRSATSATAPPSDRAR